MLLINWLKNSKSREQGRHSSRRKKSPPFQPIVQILEDRMVPSTVSWTGAVSNDWDDAANWMNDANPGQLPGAADDVVISQSGVTIIHSQAVNDAVHSVESYGAISLSGGSLALGSGDSAIHAAFTLSSEATLVETGALEVD